LKIIGRVPVYIGLTLDLLYLVLWDSDYTCDPEGKLSPFGPWFSKFRKIIKRRIGILHAVEQQLTHFYKDNLVKTQELANEMYNHFIKFVIKNNLENLKPDYEHPPIVQLCADRATILLKDYPASTFIIMNKTKADKLSGFSALLHKFGHDMSGTFKGTILVEEIKNHVKNLGVPHFECWQRWL